jgi:hypothetical protein
MTHLINRLQFELNCTDEEQAFNFRRNFGVTFQKQITDVADDICSKNVSENEWLRIDKLEIDLGRFSPSSFDENFVTIFKNKFEKELTQKLSGIPQTERKSSLRISRTELLTNFLLKGTLPWWAGEELIDINAIMLELLTHQPGIIKKFFHRHRANKNLWTRIDFQFDKEVKAGIVLLVDELKNVKELFINWSQQLNALANTEIPGLNITDDVVEKIVLKNAAEIFQNPNENIPLEIFENNIAAFFTEQSSIINKTIADNKPAFVQSTSNATTNVQQPAFQTNDEESTEEKYAVKHAGIILLSPFLKPFFTNLHLLNSSEWKNKDAQYRAVHLLKFLSTGEHKTFEYNLTLEKIICGLPVDEPIPLDVELNEDEMIEAVQLLQSVIEHWKALKNTSVNGLRESFLKRDGILSQKENGWLLQVERKTLDVLIDSIPWGYSTLAFSWNEYLIFVEW